MRKYSDDSLVVHYHSPVLQRHRSTSITYVALRICKYTTPPSIENEMREVPNEENDDIKMCLRKRELLLVISVKYSLLC